MNRKTVCGILVGGGSTRMGRPKALISVGSCTLIERTIGVARELAGDVVLLGKPDYALPQSALSLPVLPDQPAGVGPIGGLCSLLEYAGGAAAMLLACDMPRISAGLLRELLNDPYKDFDAVVFAAGQAPGAWEPCAALYRASALPALREQIARGRHALHALLATLNVATITVDQAKSLLLANMNTPADIPAEMSAEDGESEPRA